MRRAPFSVPQKVPRSANFLPRKPTGFNCRQLFSDASKNPGTVVVPGFLLGGDNRTRICDLLRVKQALYRLSYASMW